MQNQIPLDNEARLNLEQQLDQFSQQLTELDQQISDNQNIINWYVELQKRRIAQQQTQPLLKVVWDLDTRLEVIQQAINTLTTEEAHLHKALESAQQRQTITQQLSVNDIALDEAKKALDLIQATTHKNAEEFRRLLIDNQPCPVCGALA